MKYKKLVYLISFIVVLVSCTEKKYESLYSKDYSNVLDYAGTPDSPYNRSLSVFSDQGAWFAYGFAEDTLNHVGFSGPFLMTQENGTWSSEILSNFSFFDESGKSSYNFRVSECTQNSYLSHLNQVYSSDSIEVKQVLFFENAEIAIIKTEINNKTQNQLSLNPRISGKMINPFLHLSLRDNSVKITSDQSNAIGTICINDALIENIDATDSSYTIHLNPIQLASQEKYSFTTLHFFGFSANKEIKMKEEKYYDQLLSERISEKANQFNVVESKIADTWKDPEMFLLAYKSMLSLQNNWRAPAEGLHFAGCFPSYHYKWFHGFWAWDSWKHALSLVHFNPDLAKDQVRAMYDFQEENGFIADCIYRDTTIEANNLRNTKPPLSGWAIWKIYLETADTVFLHEMYPKVKRYHEWWYEMRDIDQDGLCEYGSTDGTLIAAKWESGMDNAIRFDSSKILKNTSRSFSLNQESVDLNAYLYAEKDFLSKMSKELNLKEDCIKYEAEAKELKSKIQKQFWDPKTGWFYDTHLDGVNFVKVMGPEGWIPLWAGVASDDQAKSVRNHLMDTSKFFTKVPFPTVTADHPNFEPNGGYWRGPVWLDQAYFAVAALRNYGFNQEADKATRALIENAEGLTKKGISIRENYHPLTGEGLESHHFSWSAAHYLMLLMEEE